MDKEAIGELLLRQRRRLGKTQAEMAEELGVEPGTYAAWERGEREPQRRFMKRIEDVLSWPVTLSAGIIDR